MIAHSTGEFPAGIDVPEPTEPTEPTGGSGGGTRSLKRTISVVSLSPQKSQRNMYFPDRLPGSDSPNASQRTMLETPAHSDVEPTPAAPEPETPAAPEPETPARGSTSMMLPPPVPTRPEEKDALFWKFFGLTILTNACQQWQTYDI